MNRWRCILDGVWLIFTLNNFSCAIKAQKWYLTAHNLRISSVSKRPTHKWNRKSVNLQFLTGCRTHQRQLLCFSEVINNSFTLQSTQEDWAKTNNTWIPNDWYVVVVCSLTATEKKNTWSFYIVNIDTKRSY